MKQMLQKTIVFTVVLFALFSCENVTNRPKDTATSGEIKMGVDESYQPLLEEEIFVFESLYKKTKINAYYAPEAQIVQDLLNDSIRVAVICRDLSDQEKKYFKSKTTPAFTIKVAVDALAIVLNNDNPDSLLTLSAIKRIFSGQDTSWAQINSNNKAGTINIVFDNKNSANYRYIQQDILAGKALNKNAFAADGNLGVLDYVSKNKNAMGLVSVAWLSDKRDSLENTFSNFVRLAAVSENDNPSELSDYKKPYQAWIYNKTYPLRRDVYIIKLGTRSGLGTGFAAHLAGEKGQLIVHKQGMVAAQSPVRLIQVK